MAVELAKRRGADAFNTRERNDAISCASASNLTAGNEAAACFCLLLCDTTAKSVENHPFCVCFAFDGAGAVIELLIFQSKSCA